MIEAPYVLNDGRHPCLCCGYTLEDILEPYKQENDWEAQLCGDCTKDWHRKLREDALKFWGEAHELEPLIARLKKRQAALEEKAIRTHPNGKYCGELMGS